MTSVKMPDEPPLIELVGRATRLLAERLQERQAAAGFDDVSFAHQQVFAWLTIDGLRLTELARRSFITKQSMGQLVDDLEAKGYVERVPDPTDGRAKLIRFAPRGLAALRHAYKAFGAMETEIADRIGPKKLQDIKRALMTLLAPAEAG